MRTIIGSHYVPEYVRNYIAVDSFGKYYTGSTKCRHRQIKRKKMAKRK